MRQMGTNFRRPGDILIRKPRCLRNDREKHGGARKRAWMSCGAGPALLGFAEMNATWPNRTFASRESLYRVGTPVFSQMDQLTLELVSHCSHGNRFE